jgi:hypothetical protein
MKQQRYIFIAASIFTFLLLFSMGWIFGNFAFKRKYASAAPPISAAITPLIAQLATPYPTDSSTINQTPSPSASLPGGASQANPRPLPPDVAQLREGLLSENWIFGPVGPTSVSGSVLVKIGRLNS